MEVIAKLKLWLHFFNTLYVLSGSQKIMALNFYPRDAMLARVFATATCLSVRPSVRLSVCHKPVLCQNEES